MYTAVVGVGLFVGLFVVGFALFAVVVGLCGVGIVGLKMMMKMMMILMMMIRMMILMMIIVHSLLVEYYEELW